MASSLSNLVDNLAERIHKIKYKDCDCFLEYESINDKGVYIKYVGERNGGFYKFLKKKFRSPVDHRAKYFVAQ